MILQKLVLLLLFYFGNCKKIPFVLSPETDPCLTLGNRPRQSLEVPSSTFIFGGDQFPASRHHIIPLSTLRSFFNVATQNARLVTPIGEYLYNRLLSIISQIASQGTTVQNLRFATNNIELDVTEEMFVALLWMPGNIFYGPAPGRRSDDPGEGFEIRSSEIIRDSNLFTTFHTLYRDMLHYIQDPNNIQLFDEILRNLDIVNQRSLPFAFNPSDWGFGNGKFFIRTRNLRHDELKKKREAHAITDSKSQLPSTVLFATYDICDAIKRQWPTASTNEQDYSVIFI